MIKIKTQNHFLYLLTVQENLVTDFFKMRKHLMKFFLICEFFFDFFNKYAQNYFESFFMLQKLL